MSTPTLQPQVSADVTQVDVPLGPAPPRRRRRRSRLPYWLITPALVFMVLVHVLPAIGGIALSFKKFNLFTFRLLFDAPWNGIENYRAILLDSDNPLHSGFWGAVSNTAVYTFWTVSGTLIGGLAIALLLHRKMAGQRIVRTLMLVPWIVPSYVVAVLWSFMWQSDVGIVNKVLVDYTHLLGHRPIWLLGPNTMWAIVIPSIWRGLPLAILIFLAGLQAQPQELHEAAAIDGAGPLRRLRFITLPLLRPLIGVQLLFGVIYAAYQFAIPTVMFGSNPGPDADLMMTFIVRQSFSNSLYGLGAAASTMLMIAMLLWVAVWYRAFRRDLEVT
jgi:multiple sugar transport system permease protein